eukprot:jgi/Chrzof1/14804/Cz09g16230.t1
MKPSIQDLDSRALLPSLTNKPSSAQGCTSYMTTSISPKRARTAPGGWRCRQPGSLNSTTCSDDKQLATTAIGYQFLQAQVKGAGPKTMSAPCETISLTHGDQDYRSPPISTSSIPVHDRQQQHGAYMRGDSRGTLSRGSTSLDDSGLMDTMQSARSYLADVIEEEPSTSSSLAVPSSQAAGRFSQRYGSAVSPSDLIHPSDLVANPHWVHSRSLDLESLDQMLDDLVILDPRMRWALIHAPPIQFETILAWQWAHHGGSVGVVGGDHEDAGGRHVDATFMTSCSVPQRIPQVVKQPAAANKPDKAQSAAETTMQTHNQPHEAVTASGKGMNANHQPVRQQSLVTDHAPVSGQLPYGATITSLELTAGLQQAPMHNSKSMSKKQQVNNLHVPNHDAVAAPAIRCRSALPATGAGGQGQGCSRSVVDGAGSALHHSEFSRQLARDVAPSYEDLHKQIQDMRKMYTCGTSVQLYDPTGWGHNTGKLTGWETRAHSGDGSLTGASAGMGYVGRCLVAGEAKTTTGASMRQRVDSALPCLQEFIAEKPRMLQTLDRPKYLCMARTKSARRSIHSR